jgi:dTDP-4-amino-4,6-dideoxygalactose transaminase/RimJ/RimL family protein N-acetyltransferase
VNERVRLRRAAPEDARLLFDWRNRPEIVELGSQRRTVTWEEHSAWYASVLQERERLVHVIELDGVASGQIRFDREDEQDRDAVVSVYLLAPHTGKGFGVEALRQGCAEVFACWQAARVLAFVRADNRASQSGFAKAGFLPIGSDAAVEIPEGHVALVLPRPADVPHNRLTHDEQEVAAVTAVVRSGRWAAGPHVAALEDELSAQAGVRGAVCVATGSSALRLALAALGVGEDDEVAMPAYSCVALANAALVLGAKPQARDVREPDFNLDPSAVAAGAKKPKAVIAVHTFGVSADIDALARTAPVIEDCSHAFGRQQQGKQLGACGKLAILSLYATKLLGAGQGGAVLSDDATLLARVRDLRDYADKLPSALRLNDQMTDLCAAIASVQLQRLPALLAARRERAKRYDRALRMHPEVLAAAELPAIDEDRVWYRYALTLRQPRARAVVAELERRGVHAARPVDEWTADLQTACPVAFRAYESVVSLPLYPSLSEDEQERVVHAFVQACRRVAA